MLAIITDLEGMDIANKTLALIAHDGKKLIW